MISGALRVGEWGAELAIDSSNKLWNRVVKGRQVGDIQNRRVRG